MDILQPVQQEAGDQADEDAGADAADEEDGQVIGNLEGLGPQAGGGDLTDVVQDAACNADGDGGEQAGFLQQDHACKAYRRTGQAKEQALQISEQQRYQRDPDDADHHGLLPAYPVQEKYRH